MKRLVATKLVGAFTVVIVVPPVLAGVFGSLGLAVVAGMASLFAGLVGMSVVVSRWERLEHRALVPPLPKARLLRR